MMNELITAQEVIEIQQIVYKRLTDVFCQTNSKVHQLMVNDSKYKLRELHQTSDMGCVVQFMLRN